AQNHLQPWLSITGSWALITRQHSVLAEYYQRGREQYVNNTVLSPVSSCTLLCMALHSRISRKHTQHIM
ncbi:unnamed protein product, partial [Staurois parvus]